MINVKYGLHHNKINVKTRMPTKSIKHLIPTNSNMNSRNSVF